MKKNKPMAQYIWQIEAEKQEKREALQAKAALTFIIVTILFAEPFVNWLFGA